jgi:methyl-accepting chemotaxis protein
MLKSLFSLTILRYPGLVRGVIIAILLLTWLQVMVGGALTAVTIAIILTFSVFSIAFYFLVERYYVQVVFSLCFVFITLGSFSTTSLYLLNDSAIFETNLVAITFGGLLLGGLGATIALGYTLLWFIIGEIVILNQIIPPPVGYMSGSFNAIGAISSQLLILMLNYSVILFFAYVVRTNLSSVGKQRDELGTALSQIQQQRAVEQQTGGAIVKVMTRLSHVSQEQLSSVHEQVAALSQVSSTIEELSATALSIADIASDVANAAEQTVQSASHSQGAVNDSMGAMMMLKAQVQAIVERTLALNERILRIGEVTGVVSSITAQTHLLALNAAIEAAGAGKEGERFAVVAGEVKKLAARSQVQANEIRDLLAEVQRANSASVMATEQGLKNSDVGMVRMRSVADASIEVIDSASQTHEKLKVITAATQQQRTASEQMVETIHHLRITAQGVADAASQIDKSVTELAALAAQLGTIIGGGVAEVG